MCINPMYRTCIIASKAFGCDSYGVDVSDLASEHWTALQKIMESGKANTSPLRRLHRMHAIKGKVNLTLSASQVSWQTEG
jgi:hypothetical protein